MSRKNRTAAFKKIEDTVTIVLMLIGSLTLLIFFAAASSAGEEKLLKGICINGVEVGGMTDREAAYVIDNRFNRRFENQSLTIIYKNNTWDLSLKELNASYDVEKAIKDAYRASEETDFLQKILIELRIKRIKKNIELNILYDAKKLSYKIDNIQKEIREEPVDAKISFDSNRFNITYDIPGLEVDTDKLVTRIENIIKSENEDNIINLPVKKIYARRTYDILKTISTKISGYQTAFGTGNTNRVSNIKLGTAAVDGSVVMPGEIFSLNKALGPRIEKYGYKEAPIIINSELVSGLGGGVCQIASTLYNAVLLANLDIVERKNHGLRINYVGLGRDATISGDYLDLKFKNNRNYPVYIRGIVRGNRVYFEVYGDSTTPGMKVKIITDIIETIVPKEPKIIEDYSLPEGDVKIVVKPKKGYKVKAYRKTYINGRLVRDELLSEDYYKAVRGEIIRGKRPQETSQ